jgi:hypothetical protein
LLQLSDWFDSDDRISGGEAYIGRHLPSPQCLDTNGGFNRAAGGKGMAKKSFRARNRRQVLTKNSLQRTPFRNIIIARAGAMGIHVINRTRLQTRPAQG